MLLIFWLLILFDILMVLPILVLFRYRKYYENLFNFSVGYCKYRLGYLISICGKIRMGKSSLLSGLSHVFQIIIMGNNNEIMKEVRNEFYFIDFNEFEKVISDCYYRENINDLDLITDKLLLKYNLFGDYLKYNFLNFESVKQLIKNYVEAYYVIYIRDQYVYSKTRVYSHITNKMNLEYDLDWTKIKEAYRNKNYAIYDNFVELQDEATDELGAANQYEDMKDESGAKEYKRKYGNMHREKNYMITSKQDSSDEIARHRRLYQTNIEIVNKVNVIGNFKKINYFINKILSFVDSFNRYRFMILALLKGIIDVDEREQFINVKLKGKVFGRKLEYKLTFLQKFLFSKSYCEFNCNIYQKEEDVGKENTNSRHYYDDYTFVIPLAYCFGCFNTHEYSYIESELIKHSDVHFEDLQQALMFNRVNKSYFK
ncbi:hypothetical protein KHQ81_10875 [Mycoplasmatota bacterium]|nr:hypothetical protein KHQ81_10875 [Mycoplasmatota bacterium]